MFPTHRPRRLRATPAMRRLVAETDLRPRQLVLPMFVREGIDEPVPVASMPGVVQHTRETLRKAATEAVAAGVGGLMLFGVPARATRTGSAGVDPDGILNVALRDVRAEVGDAHRRHGRPLPRRVHRPRPLRRARRARRASTTTPPSPSTPRWPWRRPRRAPTWSARAG